MKFILNEVEILNCLLPKSLVIQHFFNQNFMHSLLILQPKSKTLFYKELFLRYNDGVVPTNFLKAVLNDERLLKPASKAIVDIV